MAQFPPPKSPSDNPLISPFSAEDSSDKEKTTANNQSASTQQSGHTNQRAWAAATPKSPRLQSKPSKISLTIPPTGASASTNNHQQQNHTPPLLTPRGGARSQQPSSDTDAHHSPDQLSTHQADATAATNYLMNSASPVHVRVSPVNTTTTTTTTTTATSKPVNTTTAATRSSDAAIASDTNSPRAEKSVTERRLKKTDKKAAVSGKTGASSAIDGADLSPKEMAKFLRRAVTEDGKLSLNESKKKTFMRADLGKVNGISAQTCFAQFLHPIINSSEFHNLYKTMAADLLAVKRDENGNEKMLISALDDICLQQNVNPQNITVNAAVQKLLDPVVKPLFSYLNDVGDSVANSKLPGKLLQFMIEFDRELVKWHKEMKAQKSDITGDEKTNAAPAANPLSQEEFRALRRNAQLAILGVKGIDGYLTVQIYNRLKELGFHSAEGTGSVLKNFNSYLSKIYSQKCDTFINSVLVATDKDLDRIRDRRSAEEKVEREKKAEKKFSRLNQPSGISQQSSVDESVNASVLSGKQLHALEDVNEQLMDSLLSKYRSLNDFPSIISRMVKAVDAGYTRSGKSPSEKNLKKIAVDSIQEELDAVAEKISIIQDPTLLGAQQAIYGELSILMGQILTATEHNPFEDRAAH